MPPEIINKIEIIRDKETKVANPDGRDQNLLMREIKINGSDNIISRFVPEATWLNNARRCMIKGYPDTGFIPEQSLTREQALRGMTEWAAYAQFEENEKGRLLPGFFADFTVLSADLMTASEKDLPFIQAEMVYVAGERVK